MNSQDPLRAMIRDLVRQSLLESNTPMSYSAPWTGVEYEAHPSRLQFNIAEATLASSEGLHEFASPQACSIEKNKPCDQCGLCRSLGF